MVGGFILYGIAKVGQMENGRHMNGVTIILPMTLRFYLKENDLRAEAIEFARQTPPHQARAKLLRGNWVIYDLRLGRITEVFDGRFVVTEHHWSN